MSTIDGRTPDHDVSTSARDQVNAELLTLLQRLNTPPGKPNSPSTFRILFSGAGFWTAIVTAIVSLCTNILVQRYQARQAQYQLDQRRAGERLQAQFSMLSTFGRRFPEGLNLAYRVADLSVWLTANAEQSTSATLDEMTWRQQLSEWEKLKDRFLQEINPVSLCAEVAATYDSPRTIADTNALLATVRELVDVPDVNTATVENVGDLQKKISELHLRADTQYLALLSQLGAELRSKNGQ